MDRKKETLVEFVAQVAVVFTVIIFCIVNLTLYQENTNKQSLWISLLSTCLGFLIPGPTFRPTPLISPPTTPPRRNSNGRK